MKERKIFHNIKLSILPV